MKQNKAKVIGITGGIGCGKSAVLTMLRDEFHFYIIQSDYVAQKLYQKGNKGYTQIVEHFGTGILGDDKEIDRPSLGAVVFKDADEMAVLNRIVHPLVYESIREEVKAHCQEVSWIAVEAALPKELEEIGVCEELWYVYADESIRRGRLKAQRGYSDEKMDQIFKVQCLEETFRKHCSICIDNSFDLSKTRESIKKAICQ